MFSFWLRSVEGMRNKLKVVNKGVEVEPVPKPTDPRTSQLSKFRSAGVDGKMDDDQDVADEAPTKCISAPVVVDINAVIKFIDFEGRVDAESLQKILAWINPKRMVHHESP